MRKARKTRLLEIDALRVNAMKRLYSEGWTPDEIARYFHEAVRVVELIVGHGSDTYRKHNCQEKEGRK